MPSTGDPGRPAAQLLRPSFPPFNDLGDRDAGLDGNPAEAPREMHSALRRLRRV